MELTVDFDPQPTFAVSAVQCQVPEWSRRPVLPLEDNRLTEAAIDKCYASSLFEGEADAANASM